MEYRFSSYHTIASLGVVGILLAAIRLGGGGMEFINVPAFLFVVLVPFFLLLGNFKAGFLRFMPNALLALFACPLKPQPLYAEIAKYGARYAAGAGAVGALTGLIQVFMGMTQPEQLGSATVAILLTILYALILSEFLFAFLYRVYSAPRQEIPPLSLTPLAVGIITAIVVLLEVLLVMACFRA